METEFCWTTVIHGINVKQQNYYASCFAASYQNLIANISSSRRQICVSNYCDIELMEYNYMGRHGCNLDEKPPSRLLVEGFVTNCINELGCSSNSIRGAIDVDELVGFGQTSNYNIGYMLWIGNDSSLHSQALFIRKINDVDHYVLLNSGYPCLAEDVVDFIQPCSDGFDALHKLRISNSICGGIMSVFY